MELPLRMRYQQGERQQKDQTPLEHLWSEEPYHRQVGYPTEEV